MPTANALHRVVCRRLLRNFLAPVEPGALRDIAKFFVLHVDVVALSYFLVSVGFGLLPIKLVLLVLVLVLVVLVPPCLVDRVARIITVE